MRRIVKLKLKKLNGRPGIVTAIPSDRPEHKGQNVSKLSYGNGFVDWIKTEHIKDHYEVLQS